MRDLQNYLDKEGTFEGVLERCSYSQNNIPNFLITHIKTEEGKVIDHTWNNLKRSLKKKVKGVPFKNNKIKFRATSYEYTRRNGTKDYGLKISEIIDIKVEEK